MSKKFFTYLSHSWRHTDVDLNIAVWEKLSSTCNLLVDSNLEKEPPYYINRIEEYIRRSDLFFAVLTLREEEDLPKCSKPSLFEIRLAERARKPRFILYEHGCGFVPPEEKSEYVCYHVFERSSVLNFGNSDIDDSIEAWLCAIKKYLTPKSFKFYEASLALLPGSRQDDNCCIHEALREGGYTRTSSLGAVTTDAEVINKLSSTGLLVADVSSTELADVVTMAHAIFLPTIRVAKKDVNGDLPELPWYLKGHPLKGYEADVIYYRSLKELYQPVKDRAAAMRDTRQPITTLVDGRKFFERRRWNPHFIFISHSLCSEKRGIIEKVFKYADEKSIRTWEYVESGEPGADWKEQLSEKLLMTTHAIVLVDEGFDKSDYCCFEIEQLKLSIGLGMIKPFLLKHASRSALIRDLHHKDLPNNEDDAAQEILRTIIQLICK